MAVTVAYRHGGDRQGMCGRGGSGGGVGGHGSACMEVTGGRGHSCLFDMHSCVKMLRLAGTLQGVSAVEASRVNTCKTLLGALSWHQACRVLGMGSCMFCTGWVAGWLAPLLACFGSQAGEVTPGASNLGQHSSCMVRQGREGRADGGHAVAYLLSWPPKKQRLHPASPGVQQHAHHSPAGCSAWEGLQLSDILHSKERWVLAGRQRYTPTQASR